jgi:hypothetical protein
MRYVEIDRFAFAKPGSHVTRCSDNVALLGILHLPPIRIKRPPNTEETLKSYENLVFDDRAFCLCTSELNMIILEIIKMNQNAVNLSFK